MPEDVDESKPPSEEGVPRTNNTTPPPDKSELPSNVTAPPSNTTEPSPNTTKPPDHNPQPLEHPTSLIKTVNDIVSEHGGNITNPTTISSISWLDVVTEGAEVPPSAPDMEEMNRRLVSEKNEVKQRPNTLEQGMEYLLRMQVARKGYRLKTKVDSVMTRTRGRIADHCFNQEELMAKSLWVCESHLRTLRNYAARSIDHRMNQFDNMARKFYTQPTIINISISDQVDFFQGVTLELMRDIHHDMKAKINRFGPTHFFKQFAPSREETGSQPDEKEKNASANKKPKKEMEWFDYVSLKMNYIPPLSALRLKNRVARFLQIALNQIWEAIGMEFLPEDDVIRMARRRRWAARKKKLLSKTPSGEAADVGKDAPESQKDDEKNSTGDADSESSSDTLSQRGSPVDSESSSDTLSQRGSPVSEKPADGADADSNYSVPLLERDDPDHGKPTDTDSAGTESTETKLLLRGGATDDENRDTLPVPENLEGDDYGSDDSREIDYPDSDSGEEDMESDSEDSPSDIDDHEYAPDEMDYYMCGPYETDADYYMYAPADVSDSSDDDGADEWRFSDGDSSSDGETLDPHPDPWYGWGDYMPSSNIVFLRNYSRILERVTNRIRRARMSGRYREATRLEGLREFVFERWRELMPATSRTALHFSDGFDRQQWLRLIRGGTLYDTETESEEVDSDCGSLD
ncbi:hypothetical protein QBC47DRAFT_357797 [Echria macrotheca]|uniref:Uncharacterized protein n=1 Tax=Echria macrotheca TaxID=438768 RepID=A0AAJ0BKJ8_9PEZI|nr:hypothetical protein QBC47DRAFT_357797 [Echria macrotheca]